MSFTYDELVAHPGLLGAIQHLARVLRGRFDENPRLARLLSAHQKWLLTQMAMALSAEQRAQGFTVAQLREMVISTGVASRNTVQNYLDQLEIYRYIEKANRSAATRPKRYRATQISEQGIFNWYLANLSAIDGMDNGNRAATLMAYPQIVEHAQPAAARACLADQHWTEPPERVGLFQWVEAGGLVMDEIVTRVRDTENERIDIGYVDVRALAATFMMSRTHLQRLLNKAAEQGSVGWMDDTPRSAMWLSRDFLCEYCGWQARKLKHVEDAFLEAKSLLRGQLNVAR
ncbi:hypothetical protein [Agrobacterium larrymoorei]|uniref:MarR family transcriptional regulator n=1 Tax=Agrobacterium larrymoorei TaxID=160699 RepID=A0ABU0UKP6_9HYPH|nr:hypothetical protein [Agrobacterium larrymoorei]MDQ1185531.1 hypothetical protein [Agrobacterium larrymoorei]